MFAVLRQEWSDLDDQLQVDTKVSNAAASSQRPVGVERPPTALKVPQSKTHSAAAAEAAATTISSISAADPSRSFSSISSTNEWTETSQNWHVVTFRHPLQAGEVIPDQKHDLVNPILSHRICDSQ